MESAQEVATRKTDKEIYEPPTVKDPWELMAGFYEGDRYKDSLASFYENKKVDDSVSEKEKEKTFLDNEAARIALIDYGTEDVLFKYESSNYYPRVREEINNYIKVVEDVEGMDPGMLSSDELAAVDVYRNMYHNRAAEALVKDGVAPSVNVGQAIASLVLIDKGLDTPDSVKSDSTPNKVERKLGIS